MNAIDCDFLVLGAGLAGLAAASGLGRRTIVLERERRPGGLTRTERRGDYWFDHSVHLLYFAEQRTEQAVRALLGDMLAPCPPKALVVTAAGVARYPLQLHLGDLRSDAVVDCLADMARTAYSPRAPPRHFAEWLEASFGQGMCRLFFFQYNRKLYKYPLETLAPVGFQWNIAQPDFRSALKGAFGGSGGTAYNANGWYPRPPEGSPQRGIEVLPRALARHVYDLRLGHEIVAIDLGRRQVVARQGEQTTMFHYRRACCATLPLDRLVALCADAPRDLKAACRGLRYNRVRSVAVNLRGDRPSDGIHWRYYPDEALVFHRVIHPHAFDPLLSPPDGWSALAEISEPADAPPAATEELVERTVRDLRDAGEIPSSARIVSTSAMQLDAAYVVFGLDDRAVVERARTFLEERGMSTVGRYARWEYSSMAQVLGDGFEWRSRWAGDVED